MISVGFNAAARFASLNWMTRWHFHCLVRGLITRHSNKWILFSVRVSNELGAGNPKSAFFSVWVVTVLCGTITVILAIVILCLRNYISYLFTEGETVSNAVADLCPLLAITLILNGIQPVLSGKFQIVFACVHVVSWFLTSSLVRHPDDRFICPCSQHCSSTCRISYPHLYFIFIPISVLGQWWLIVLFLNRSIFWLKLLIHWLWQYYI